ncbi:MAG: acyl-CoA dehydrogenase, partial [Sideroxyarcus sp.]|nr:acyl-CoA dehydrogenase [Sideroxyarcus sp.]
ARNRTQGRTVGRTGKNTNGPPVPIIAHDDVKRMLLAQKSYCEGALALCLYGARLVDEKKTGSPEQAEQAIALLELLTPVAKSWPSQWCLEANSLAIQVHGGYGYTRDFPVEQHWRDNRLNMIHEGTHGIQALDLLGRKILGNDGAGMRLWILRVEATMHEAATYPELLAHINSLGDAIASLQNAVRQLGAVEIKQHALANSTDFMQAFGHIVVAWLWLDVACVVCRLLPAGTGVAKEHLRGLLQAAHFFFRFELPKVSAWLEVSADCDPTVREMQDAWF